MSLESLSSRTRALAALVRRIAGMPDYEAHVEHLRTAHPDRPLPTRREYFERFVSERYSGTGTRCC